VLIRRTVVVETGIDELLLHVFEVFEIREIGLELFLLELRVELLEVEVVIRTILLELHEIVLDLWLLVHFSCVLIELFPELELIDLDGGTCGGAVVTGDREPK
jgi:hypothetical protein